MADTVYGGNLDLRTWLEDRGYSYVLAVACNEPVGIVTPDGVRRRVEAAQVETFMLDAKAWQRLSMSEGSKGPRLFDWACVPLLHRWEDDGQHWVLIRRNLTDLKEKAYYFVFAPKGTTLSEMVQAIGARWHIEIVQPQMTKTEKLTARSSGDHIADLHLLVGDHDTINQPLNQLSFLLEGGLSQSLLDSLAKGFN